MPDNKDIALRKRQQIDSSKKTMFLFVAGAAFVSGVALVVAFFLVQQILFHASVVSEKQKTIATLDHNKRSIDELKKNVQALEANDALNAAKLNDRSGGLQTILDALPAGANADALGASLQRKFVEGINGIALENLSVTYTPDESGADGAEVSDGQAVSPSVTFAMTVSGSSSSIKELLVRFERSIRTIEVNSIEIQSGDDGRITMSLNGKAYFEPAQTIKLEKKVVKP
ncbi:MAG: hypothetical protein Q4F02_01235 [Candidatus Saccharibacteria bacterium]|nr:hypothetical protein [Candidatus Saccharibacteria bacterium]